MVSSSGILVKRFLCCQEKLLECICSFVWESLQFMNFSRKEFLTDIDFWSAGVMQGLF